VSIGATVSESLTDRPFCFVVRVDLAKGDSDLENHECFKASLLLRPPLTSSGLMGDFERQSFNTFSDGFAW
jgi:hypothetical protein